TGALAEGADPRIIGTQAFIDADATVEAAAQAAGQGELIAGMGAAGQDHQVDQALIAVHEPDPASAGSGHDILDLPTEEAVHAIGSQDGVDAVARAAVDVAQAPRRSHLDQADRGPLLDAA